MNMLFKALAFTFLVLNSVIADAEQVKLKPFTSGSYQQILEQHANKPLMLVIWSLTCSSCLKDMALLDQMHKAYPALPIVMLATDDVSALEQIQQILNKNNLSELENWQFAEDNPQKLRYQIDPKWYGELPRTYFFDKKHIRHGVSGVLTRQDYDNLFKSIMN